MSAHSLDVICSYDSYIKAALPAAEYFAAQGYEVRFFLIKGTRFLNIYSEELLASNKAQRLDLESYFGLNRRPSAILASLNGRDLTKFHRLYREEWVGSDSTRPIVANGYCGIAYEDLVGGFNTREPADVFFLNNQYELDFYSEYAKGLGSDGDNLYLTGLPVLDESFRRRRPSRSSGILFVEQPTVPGTVEERIYIVNKLPVISRIIKERDQARARVDVLNQNLRDLVSPRENNPYQG